MDQSHPDPGEQPTPEIAPAAITAFEPKLGRNRLDEAIRRCQATLLGRQHADGFWHAPLILAGFNYPGYPVLGVVAMMGMTTTFGCYINEMTLRHRSSILAGWMHGAFNGQFYGLWRLLFPGVHPLIGGVTGLVGMIVWAALGLAVARPGKSLSKAEPGAIGK